MSDSELCNFIKEIQKDPSKKLEGLTVKKIYQLQEHLKECQECIRITDDILEVNKDVKSDPNSEWERTKYN
jgi:transcription elongation factor GreA-like protein